MNHPDIDIRSQDSQGKTLLDTLKETAKPDKKIAKIIKLLQSSHSKKKRVQTRAQGKGK